MLFGDLNLLMVFFIFLLFSIFINNNTALHLLLTAELLWITLYCIALFVGFVFDNLNVLSLTFFFLIFSAIEFGVGLILLLIQNLIFRSIYLFDFDVNYLKFILRFKRKLYVNKFSWKW